jgi:predicted nuclease of predicted toxin-antitoxin system
MILVADECLNKNIVRFLKSNDYEVISISETYLGIDDEEVLKKTKNFEGILITEDSDFGKWVFAHHFKGVSVIFLRYDKEDFNKVIDFLIESINLLINTNSNQFVTITPKKVRLRAI